ncbi:MAG: hypothetical protein MN733_13600, partial [Nitrososphaera sp.]|nr:hypothetical protein [Nitrososphaera sp.]
MKTRAFITVLPIAVTPETSCLTSCWTWTEHLIRIGGGLAAPPLLHHRAYGSRTRRFDETYSYLT